MSQSFEFPATTVHRVVKETIPDIQVSKDAKAAFARSAGVFLLYLTSTGQEFTHEAKRTTLMSNDVLYALDECDLAQLKPAAQLALEEWRERAAAPRVSGAKAEATEADGEADGEAGDDDNRDDEDEIDEDEDDAADEAADGPPTPQQTLDADGDVVMQNAA